MRCTSVLRKKGQITIPEQIRSRLRLNPGDRLDFVIKGDKVVLRPIRPSGNPFLEYVGALSSFRTKEEVDAWISELRDEND